MAEKSGAPEAPPSYEASQQGEAAGAGGFKSPYPQQPPPPTMAYSAPGQPSYGAPPAGPAQPPPPVHTSQPVIVQYVQTPNFGPHPVNLTCPHCQNQIQTSTDSEPGPMAWILAGVLCIIGLWPCACIPCCIDSLNSVTHKCPQCKNFLGRYKGGM